MNIRMIAHILSRVLFTTAVLLLLPALVCLIYGESLLPFLLTALLCALLGAALLFFPPTNQKIYAKEGFVVVSLSWILISALGALPFVFSGNIPNYIDAFFETVSGFTTTGSTVLNDVEALGQGCLFWRSFTHWIGGMGVLVFILAVLPMSGRSIHIMRAEVPGPSVGKLVPNARKTAIILYGIYIVITMVEVILLCLGGMNLFDSLIHSFGTAGTGGFSDKALSIGYYDSAYIDAVITIFMLLFGVNFNLYFLLLLKKWREAIRSEELHFYAVIVVLSSVLIALFIMPQYGGFFRSLRFSSFQVASIISTTGYGTADFNLWPVTAKAILVLLMFSGACAGSTCGGMKLSRVMLLGKGIRQELRKQQKPHSVSVVRLEGKPVAEGTLHTALVFFSLYIAILLLGTLIVSLDGLDLVTDFTAVLSCLSNIGPGLELVGPMGSFSVFSAPVKLLLSLIMLLGRLELFPLFLLFSPAVWRKQ